MKKTLLLLLFVSSICLAQNKSTTEVNTVLDDWHKAAAAANFDAYFDLMADESIFIGTDPTENWNKKAFMDFARPYFAKGKAWHFTSLERNVYFDNSGKTAWFDELLQTQMKICRGSGVLIKQGKKWKIKHYVLSMTVPNENTNEVVKIKTPIEDLLMEKLKSKKESNQN